MKLDLLATRLSWAFVIAAAVYFGLHLVSHVA